MKKNKKPTKARKAKNMNSPKHHVVLILDCSGSMAYVVNTTIQGVNELISTGKNVIKEQTRSGREFDVYGTFVTFETTNRVMAGYDNVPFPKLKGVGTSEVYAGGGTHMNTAIFQTIQHMDKIVKDQDSVMVTIFTDGDTQDSFTDAARMVAERQKQGWTFAFIGANQDAKAVARKLNIPETNAMEYQSDVSGTRSAFYRLARATRKYLERRATWSPFATGIFHVDNFFNDPELALTKMTVAGMSVSLNMPEAMPSDEEKEKGKKLPPYAPVPAYKVDEYPACPSNWKHGSSKSGSYFVAVKEGHGMWLDFNGCDSSEYDVAAVISVQGVNPITGQKQTGLSLEKYDNKCPVHDVEFHQDRFCPKCSFKWPTQNYLATTGTPHGQFWLDGFRTPDGKVRQYIFTEDESKGVAAKITKNEQVYAVGVAFYRSKKKKEILHGVRGWTGYSGAVGASGPSGYSGMLGAAGGPVYRSMSANTLGTKSLRMKCAVSGPGGASQQSYSPPPSLDATKGGDDGFSRGPSDTLESLSFCDDTDGPIGSDSLVAAGGMPEVKTSMSINPVTVQKNYEVGAGAKIEQEVHADPNKLDYWDEEPVAMVYINYADEETVKNILAAGKREEVEEGFLAGIPVGKE